MNLTSLNTAIVLDSTADFPEAPKRFPNWLVVPLYVRFGDESFKDYVELGPDERVVELSRMLSGSPDSPWPASRESGLRSACSKYVTSAPGFAPAQLVVPAGSNARLYESS